ncbi:MAG: PAS-domain containing protein [Alphaproteobacteria bacterium]|nr:PAS-domain containing protein [Alphaproteobacteria bacterium]MBQ8677732.1 PAS-domain containing protein [Alphaproteobacteria bacterium]
MNKELMLDMFYAAPELWYMLLLVFLLLLGFLLYFEIRVLKLTQKNYFINRDRERYAETLYASKDGYFAFIYPDEKVNDPQNYIKERCSRRLAVILDLPQGTASTFEDVLKCFYKDDTKKIIKYVTLLREDGVSFEEDFVLKNNERKLKLNGARINANDGNLYCDMIWFRDISNESLLISTLEENKKMALLRSQQLEDIIDNLPYPAWLRDDKLNLVLVNKKYLEFIKGANKYDIIQHQIEICGTNNVSVSKELAEQAQSLNRTQSEKISLIKNGQHCSFEVWESPFHLEGYLDKIWSVGTLIDITELDSLKRNLKLHQNAHFEILGTLGTAFAVFNSDYKLSFYNKAFALLWQQDSQWLDSSPSYSSFLENVREKRLLPEVPDFKSYKDEELSAFNKILEPKEDLLHLPNDNTIRRVRSPHPMGGLVFAFEDVSDRLATQRAYNALVQVQTEILDNLFDAVIIFGSNGRLNAYNQAYLSLWNLEEIFLQKEPSITELLEEERHFFNNVENWQDLKSDIIEHLTNANTKTFRLIRNDGVQIDILSSLLSDGSIMVTNKAVN